MQRNPKLLWNLLRKTCVFFLTCLTFSHFQSTLHLMICTYRQGCPAPRRWTWPVVVGSLLGTRPHSSAPRRKAAIAFPPELCHLSPPTPAANCGKIVCQKTDPWCQKGGGPLPSKAFFQCSKQFLDLSVLMTFSASAVFCFTSSTWQNVFLWELSSSGKTLRSGHDPEKRQGGTWGSSHFWSVCS